MICVQVKSDLPPSPPSGSAVDLTTVDARKYLKSTKKLFTNWPYIMMVIYLGAGMGFFGTIAAKNEQILCSRGYSDKLAGISGSLIYVIGSAASFPFGYLATRTKNPILVTKIAAFLSILATIMLSYCMRLPNQSAAIIASSILFGVFAIGPFPVALELLVECTYPIDQVSITILCLLTVCQSKFCTF